MKRARDREEPEPIWDTGDRALAETLEILSDEEAVAQLRRSIQDIKEGKTIPWDEAKASL